jgi:oligopeptidase B
MPSLNSKPSNWLIHALLVVSLATLAGCAHTKSPAPPVAKIIAHQSTIHGQTRVDNYHWLRDKKNPQVIAYLEAENEYTDLMMKSTEKFQQDLYKELLGRIKETDLSVPVKEDNYYYYSRTEKGKQYHINCRKKGSLQAKEEIVLDENILAKGHKHFSLGTYSMSPDHQILAYAVDTSGEETFTLFFKDLSTGQLLEDKIEGVYYGATWAADNKTVFYTVQDKAKRPHKILRHVLGTDSKDDRLVFHEKDEMFYVGVTISRSRTYIMTYSGSMTTSEVRFFRADQPMDEPKIIQARQHEMEYDVAHHGDKFYIVTNDGAKNFKLVEAPVADPGKENWKTVIPHRPDVKIDAVDAFKNHLVVYERKDGLKRIRIRSLSSNAEHYVDFPEPVYVFWSGENPEFDTKTFRFEYTSLITPKSVFDYDMDKKTRELKKEQEVLGGYDRSQYTSERIFATAADGTRVPISLVYRKGLKKNGQNPLYLGGYGSYGSSSEPYFSSNRLSLLDRGFVAAIAHIRGGGEMGRAWYDDGKMLKKKNTFSDFVACAEHLIAQGYTSNDRLAIGGGSAGGLLMGAVTNMRPDLFKVVVADVPFVDVVNTMLDESIPLTVIEFEEWGNPKDKKYYDYMLSYSPYDNVASAAYPNMLVTAGLNDPRVQYWEPAKWTAKLRAKKTDDNLLILKTKMDTGHMGASGRYDYLKDIAFEYVFIFDRLGITK